MPYFHRLFLHFFLILIPFLQCNGISQDELKRKMLSDLNVICNSFEVRYAPAEWKKTYADWELHEQVEIAKAKILNTSPISIKDYQVIVKNFLKTTRDYHVGAHFFSTESASLPFRVQGVNGKYFITWLKKSVTPSSWSIGDEVVLFDGQLTEQAICALKEQELGNPESLTDQGLAEIFLTFRVGTLGHVIPQGPISVVIKHKVTGAIENYELSWSYISEKVLEGPFSEKAIHSTSSHRLFDKKMTMCLHNNIKQAMEQHYAANEKDEGTYILGSKQGFLPPLGKIIWKTVSKDYFYAYIYNNGNKKIAYIRISDYTGEEEEANEFARLIKLFESKSDALIIDQTNNPGGTLLYMYGLASTLSKKPLRVPKQCISLLQEDVYEASLTLENFFEDETDDEEPPTSIYGYPLTEKLFQEFNNYCNFVIQEWNNGHSLSRPFHYFGIESLAVHPKVQYTKPILVLVNHLSFSCGDFLPAILQDNKRATIMGTRTAGAGGFLINHSYPSQMGIRSLSYTGSIAEREDNNPLENLGVIPDIIYEISEDDLQNGYREYVKAINKALQ